MIAGREIDRERERLKNEGCDGALGLGVRFRCGLGVRFRCD